MRKTRFDVARETRKPAIREIFKRPVVEHQRKINDASKDVQGELESFFSRNDTCTARDLAWMFELHFTHKQIKRWMAAFLPDSTIGQHSGRPRQFGFQEAAYIASGGILVNYYRLTIYEAKTILFEGRK
jgi:hypothetical protein